jgi:hypothetical protein
MVSLTVNVGSELLQTGGLLPSLLVTAIVMVTTFELNRGVPLSVALTVNVMVLLCKKEHIIGNNLKVLMF